MATKNNGVIVTWIFMFVIALDIIIHVQGLKTLDKNNFRPKPKGTIKSIEVPEDGDIIDCVDIYKQPAFDDPLIKDLKMAPSLATQNLLNKMASSLSTQNLFNKSRAPQPNLIQNWHKYGECPEGTIPIRRSRNNDENNHRKYPNYQPPSNREYAVAKEQGSIYHGGGAHFSLWNPPVRGPREFSLSQIWIASGRQPPINTIEAGWIVNPNRFNDSQTRIFTFWTADGYKRTGCYNLDCRGFVQTDHRISLGSAIRPCSVFGGDQYEITINIVRDLDTNQWWLNIIGVNVGFFPPGLFSSLHRGADLKVEFGGEIINNRPENRHTATGMGSGHFPSQGYGKAAFIRNIRIVNDHHDIVDASLSSRVSKQFCYSLHFGPPETVWKTNFFFGGPGYSRICQQ